MGFARNGVIRLYYETFGRAGAEPLLLINGAASQCIDFDEAFCELLAQRDFRVIRFDPRDTGLSTASPDGPTRLVAAWDAVKAGETPVLAYGLDDLVGDAAAVLDAEDVDAAHLFGRSLGGLVAQGLALSRPDRVRSLAVAIAFSRSLIDAISPQTLAAIQDEGGMDIDAYVHKRVRSSKLTGSPGYFDERAVADHARRAFGRGIHSGAAARQFAVGIAAPDLRPALARLAVPSLVIHGALDRVVPLAYARETALALPGARLHVLDDMGHDAPPEILRQWAGLFFDHHRRIGGEA